MPDVLTYRGTIYPWHCDHMGHMNIMHYVGKFDEAKTVLELTYAVSPHWAELLRRLPAAGLLSCTDEQLAMLTSSA